MRRTDLGWLVAILLIAAAIRVWAPWDDVFAPPASPTASTRRVNFLENDAWYHVRLVENQVRNFPHHVTVDPFAAPNGQYVAVAPLLDTITAAAVVLTQGRGASTHDIERVAAIVPAIVGVLAVAAVWALAGIAFDRRAALIAGLLAAILPGHFLDRTLLGFVDHHALEVLLSFAALSALALGTSKERATIQNSHAFATSRDLPAITAGVFLGLYLLAWASGAYFVAILAAWVTLAALVCPPDQARSTARAALIAAAIALLMVLSFQDPQLFRYNTQTAALIGLIVASIAVMLLAGHTVIGAASLAVIAVVIVAAAWATTPALIQQVASDLSRFRPDPTRMAVLEARPLFLYSGNWEWSQPWSFFRSGFYLGAVAVAALMWTLWRSRRADHLLIVCFTLAGFAATVGQNRFGYYLVPATAVVCGWLATVILDWGGVPHAANPTPSPRRGFPLRRELAVVIVAGAFVAPNIVPAALTTARGGGMPQFWFDAMAWLRHNTPEPFSVPDYYYARYDDAQPAAAFSIMNWWDQGYWIVQTGRRVPVANPTQGGAPVAARFYTATDEAAALDLLREQRAKYVLVDWELPFRDGANGALAGRFQNLADWAGTSTSRYYTLCFTRGSDRDPWQSVWIFHQPYYESMAYRLMVLGGRAAAPIDNAWVVETRDRVDESGRRFCELVGRTRYGTAEAATQAAAQRGPGFRAAGLTPWQPAFPVPAIAGLREVAAFHDGAQPEGTAPMIRIFQRVD